MLSRKGLYLLWVAGTALLILIFYSGVFRLWSAAEEFHVSSLEKQVVASLSRDLAEGNLFKLGDTLAKLQRDSVLRFSEVRGIGAGREGMTFYASGGADSGADAAFEGYSCGRQLRLISKTDNVVSLVTTLPSAISEVDCVALYISAEFPPEMRRLRRSILLSFGSLLAAIFAAFFWCTSFVYKKILALETQNALIQVEKEAAIGRMAAQVAHDIRSPLAALGAAAGGLNLPPEQKALIDGAVGRMQGIADDLLKRYRAPGAAAQAPKPAPHALNALVAQVAAEKRLQHGGKPGVKIEYPEPAGEIKALVEPKEFQRLLSNLVNNAVEAFERGGTVKISLAALDGKARLTVQDDGKGMPAELLARMGRKGATQGKAGGTGLGVYHAKASVESCGGAFRIDSAPGKGTTVTIELPRLERAEAPKLALLLDDDALVHMNWRMAARAAGAELKACKTPAELEAALAGLSKDVPIYIDSELGDGIKGEEIAKDLHARGYTSLSMATGHGAENFTHLPWLKAAGKEPPWASK